MRCKKCGKVMRKEELFCEACGYYNGEKDSSGWDDDQEESIDDDYEDFNTKEDPEE